MAENETAAPAEEAASEATENTETTGTITEPTIEPAATPEATTDEMTSVETTAEPPTAETAPETPAEPEAPVEPEEISYHTVEKEGHVGAIWEMQGRRHLRTIDPRSSEGKHILSLFTSEHHEEESASA